MTDKLPPNLLALFAPRPALRYLPPSDHAPESRKTNNIGGVAAFMQELEASKQSSYDSKESWFEKKERVKAEKREKQRKLLVEDVETCMCPSRFIPLFLARIPLINISSADKPSEDPQVRGDAYKTLFVARLSYETKEIDLEKEFGRYGPIERVHFHLSINSAS